MMKVKMISTAVGPDGAWLAGQVYEVDDARGMAFVAAGAAIDLSGPKIEYAMKEPVAETAQSQRGKKHRGR
jgi:hypothetical protein